MRALVEQITDSENIHGGVISELWGGEYNLGEHCFRLGTCSTCLLAPSGALALLSKVQSEISLFPMPQESLKLASSILLQLLSQQVAFKYNINATETSSHNSHQSWNNNYYPTQVYLGSDLWVRVSLTE